jgi:hypothetical protein
MGFSPGDLAKVPSPRELFVASLALVKILAHHMTDVNIVPLYSFFLCDTKE